MHESQNQYESAFRAITDVTSNERENLILVYGNSSRNTFTALGFQVVRSIRRIERSEDVVTIQDGNTEDFAIVGEDGWGNSVSNPGNDVFRVDSDRNETMVEYGFAVEQNGVYTAIETAGGDAINGVAEGSERDRGYSAQEVFEFGGVLSDITTIDAPGVSDNFPIPTTALSTNPDQGLIRIDSRENGSNPFRFAFDNRSGGQVSVDITAYGTTYNVQQIESKSTVRNLLKNPDERTRIVTYGGLGTTKPNLPGDWYDSRVAVGEDDLLPGSN